MQTDGQHLVADFWGCRLPADEEGWRRVIRSAIEAMGVTLLNLEVHMFEPQGMTAVAILAESHLAVHTWPERDYVAIDVFTCGATVRPEAGIDLLRSELEPGRERILHIPRGDVVNEPVREHLTLDSPVSNSQATHGEEPACR